MKPNKHILVCGIFAATVMVVALSAKAQIQTTGAPDLPGANKEANWLPLGKSDWRGLRLGRCHKSIGLIVNHAGCI